jgi:predicted phosphodiesterase
MGLSDDLRPSLGKLELLLERSGISVDDVSRVERVNVWQGFLKNDDGEAETVDLAGISLVPRWADGPEWPVVDRGPAVKLPKRPVACSPGDHQTAVILPDMQIGYYRNGGDDLEPTHDEAAIAAALAIVAAAKPAQVVLVGDNLDLPEFSRYRTTPAFARTTQATVDRATVLCGQLRAAAPHADIVWLAGNHEERMPNWLLDNASAAFGLRRGHTPESWPVLSVPYLCRMDDASIRYEPGYPASHHWITPKLKVIHGELVKSSGSTAHAYLGREKTSVIFGHVHRREYAARTRDDHDGPREVMAATPGCLCRTDGAIPSTKGGTELDGRPVARSEDWQQGLAVVDFAPDGRFWYEQIEIRDGQARWRGKTYAAH